MADTADARLEFIADLKRSADWSDWRWQLRNRISSVEKLSKYISLSAEDQAGVKSAGDAFRWTITPYYASLMDQDDPACPLRRQQIPSLSEMSDDAGVSDPLGEQRNSPVKSIVHVYPDRVALKVTNVCPTYCRYCFREYFVGDQQAHPPADQVDAAIDYVRQHTEIRDVLLTGGDPALLSDERLEDIFRRLRAISHVEIIRLGTRTPCTLPQRITEGFASMLAAYHPVWLNTHFNHPDEVTPEATQACDRLTRAGVPVGNQSVLLKGINDDLDVMRDLVHALVKIRVRPYYIFQCQLLKGTAHFRTPIEQGMSIVEQLCGHTTGFAVPQYILDTPHGKVPISSNYVAGRDGELVVLKTWGGRLWKEPNEQDGNQDLTLPQIKAPDAETMDTF